MRFKVSKTAEAKVKTVSSLAQLCANHRNTPRASVPRPLLEDECWHETVSMRNQAASIGYLAIDQGLPVTVAVHKMLMETPLNFKEKLYWTDVLTKYRESKYRDTSQNSSSPLFTS